MERASKIVSWLFLPMLMPIYGLLIAMYVKNIEYDGYDDNNLFIGISAELKYRVLVLFIIFTALFPMMLIMFLKQNGKIKSYEMEDKDDRGFPIFFTTFVSYYLCCFGTKPRVFYCPTIFTFYHSLEAQQFQLRV
jgi:hypothetical protein